MKNEHVHFDYALTLFFFPHLVSSHLISSHQSIRSVFTLRLPNRPPLDVTNKQYSGEGSPYLLVRNGDLSRPTGGHDSHGSGGPIGPMVADPPHLYLAATMGGRFMLLSNLTRAINFFLVSEREKILRPVEVCVG